MSRKRHLCPSRLNLITLTNSIISIRRIVLKNRFLFLSVCALLTFCGLAAAQQADIAVGVGTGLASYSATSSLQFPVQPLRGGAFPSVSADVIFHNRLGFGGEVFWRQKQGIYGGYQPYRPIFYDFNAMFQPNFGKHAGAELQAGIGGLSTRFYSNTYTCGYLTGCTNYTSSNHLSVHVGGGLRYYFWHSFFIRPEAHVYFVPNNHEFSNNTITRVGASIGYSLRPEF